MSRVDFAAVKARVTYNDVLRFLNLHGKKVGEQWRGKCQACNTDNDRALVLTAGRGAYCHAAKAGGDVLWLVSHVKGIGLKEAAQQLADHFGIVPQEPAPQSVSAAKESPSYGQADNPANGGDNVLTPLSNLAHEHPDVQALGFTAEEAKAIGLGHCSKGLMRSRVAIPLRSETGKLLGYVGTLPGCDLKRPKEFRF